jgi:hypothetical protein
LLPFSDFTNDGKYLNFDCPELDSCPELDLSPYFTNFCLKNFCDLNCGINFSNESNHHSTYFKASFYDFVLTSTFRFTLFSQKSSKNLFGFHLGEFITLKLYPISHHIPSQTLKLKCFEASKSFSCYFHSHAMRLQEDVQRIVFIIVASFLCACTSETTELMSKTVSAKVKNFYQKNQCIH